MLSTSGAGQAEALVSLVQQKTGKPGTLNLMCWSWKTQSGRCCAERLTHLQEAEFGAGLAQGNCGKGDFRLPSLCSS